MTWKEWGLKYCEERGMFPKMAEQVMGIVQKEMAEMSPQETNRLADDTEGYPPAVAVLFSIHISDAAVRWIDENLPKAWFRPLFASEGSCATAAASTPT